MQQKGMGKCAGGVRFQAFQNACRKRILLEFGTGLDDRTLSAAFTWGGRACKIASAAFDLVYIEGPAWSRCCKSYDLLDTFEPKKM